MHNADWMAVLAQLVATYGEERALRLASSDSVAVRLLNTDWMAVLEQLVATYGEERALRLVGKDRVVCKMLNADWLEELTQLVATHGEEHALWIIGNRQYYNRCTCLNLRRPPIILFLLISLEN